MHVLIKANSVELLSADMHTCTYMIQVISPIVVVVLMLALHCSLLRVTVNSYSVFGLRPVIVHGLVVHSAQPGDGGVQLTELVMSFGLRGWSHCRVVLHDSTVAATFVGGGIGSGTTVS